MSDLLFAGESLQALREGMLGSDLERGAFLLAQPVRVTSDVWRLLVTEFVQPTDGEYSRQSSNGLEIPPAILARAIKRARDTRQSVVLAHTHPWDGPIAPSEVDRAGEARILPVLFNRVPGLPHGRLILGRRDTHASLLSSDGREAEMRVKEIGGNLERPPSLANVGQLDHAFDRQIRAFGALGQQSLKQTRVAIIGLGGTGSLVALQLAHLGVERFLLIDPDEVDPTSLNRVAGASRGDVGSAKVDVSARAIHKVRPDADVVTIRGDVTKSSVARALLLSDFFFCCTDSQGSRAVLTQLAYQYLLPGIDLGVRIDVRGSSISHVVGRVQMLAPGLACTSCAGVLDPESVRRDLLTDEQRSSDKYIVGAHVPQPAVMSLNAVVSGMAINMFLAAVTGAPMRARHQIVLFGSGAVKPIKNSPDLHCSVCSQRGFLARGDSWPAPGRPDADSELTGQ